MKKFFHMVKNVFVGLFLVLYFSLIIFVSVLLLNRNDYGVTQFGNKVWILVDEEISSPNYPKGSLVILENKKLSDYKVGDEIFVYKVNDKDKSVEIIFSNIATVNNEENTDNAYVTLVNNGGSWSEEFLAGTAYVTYDKLGDILSFLQSKWIFFIFLIVPCFFILLYEIYLAIIEIKYGDEIDENVTSIENGEGQAEIADLQKQIEDLKKQVSQEKNSSNLSNDSVGKENDSLVAETKIEDDSLKERLIDVDDIPLKQGEEENVNNIEDDSLEQNEDEKVTDVEDGTENNQENSNDRKEELEDTIELLI